jgi:hypothetical protein
MLKCVVYSWSDIYQMCEKLSDKIKESFHPDVIIAIARGGWIPARIICDFLDIKDLYSVKAEHWGRVATRDKAKLVQRLNVDLTGKDILIVDDVTDTGETVILVKEHVKELGAEMVKTAVLDHKMTSKFVPDYYINKMDSWKWIVYPWSYHEDTRDFIEKLALFYEEPENVQKLLAEKYDFNVGLDVIRNVLREYEVGGKNIEIGRIKEAD